MGVWGQEGDRARVGSTVHVINDQRLTPCSHRPIGRSNDSADRSL